VWAGDELGRLEPGKLADLIIVEGDPLADIEAMRWVEVVIKDGDVIYGHFGKIFYDKL
jgi:imidazolonepropionase-like amidohydrolase